MDKTTHRQPVDLSPAGLGAIRAYLNEHDVIEGSNGLALLNEVERLQALMAKATRFYIGNGVELVPAWGGRWRFVSTSQGGADFLVSGKLLDEYATAGDAFAALAKVSA